jgi:glucosamine--fructose-6-phosphate aminotransferase (isomerizing)
MCGIIGAVSTTDTDVSSILIEGLKRLEYRGYDSAGIATVSTNGELLCRRSEGKLIRLEQEIQKNPISGATGIGHTRWATHGRPTTINAHPHCTYNVAVVHNGIIENFHDLRKQLETEGCVMASSTDTEVIPHLITHYLKHGMSPKDSVAATVKRLSGSFALAILFAGKEKFLIATKSGSPLAIGYGEDKMYVGSDAVALAPFTTRITYLEDGDLAHVSGSRVTIWDKYNNYAERPVIISEYSSAFLGKGNYKHYMLKEIHEQPDAITATLAHYINSQAKKITLPEMPFNLVNIPQVTIVACGTSYHAGMVGKYWLEHFAKLPVGIDIASEFRYRDTPLAPGGLALFISQSGETADTLAALKFAKDNRQHVISLVNVTESTMALASDVALFTVAGTEIGVASTKAFTTQLIVLACLALAFAAARKTLSATEVAEAIDSLSQTPGMVADILGNHGKINELAQEMLSAGDALFIGRGTSYPIALEGSLKLKELTYIHAEGLAAGELKHGSLALVDENMPVIALAPSDRLFEKTCSNIQEVYARNGKVTAICDEKGAAMIGGAASRSIIIPACHPLVAPILYTIPLQLLAYYVADAKGHDVDQPRNLAKSVTVE